MEPRPERSRPDGSRPGGEGRARDGAWAALAALAWPSARSGRFGSWLRDTAVRAWNALRHPPAGAAEPAERSAEVPRPGPAGAPPGAPEATRAAPEPGPGAERDRSR